MTNVSQEERQRAPPSSGGTPLQFDNQGHPTFRTQQKDFYVPIPDAEASLRNRFDVMGAFLMMSKMRYLSNSVLSTMTQDLVRDYVDDLCGERVWACVVLR